MLQLSIVSLIVSILWGFIMLYRLNKGFFLQDIRVFFLLTFSIYSLFFPILCLIGILPYFNQETVANTTFLYTSAVFAFDLVVARYRVAWINHNTIKCEGRKYFLLLQLLLLLIFLAINIIRSLGVQTFQTAENMTERSEMHFSQSWVVICYIIIALFTYLIFNFKKLNKFLRIELLSLLLFYSVFQFALGNRREVAAIFISLMALLLVRYRKHLNIKIASILLVCFLFSFYITIYRNSSSRSLSRDEAIEVAIASNEFVYPIQTTYYVMDLGFDYKFGSTYTLLPIQVFIPRTIYPDKPPTLGSEFVKKMGFRQGYALTPVTEAFWNFSYIGPFIVFLIFSIFLNKLVLKQQKGISFTYILLYGLIFDICRGDFASILYTFICMYLFGYKLFNYISNRT